MKGREGEREMKRERELKGRRTGFFFFNLNPSSSFTPTFKKKNGKKKNSHVRLLLPLHALRLGDPAAQLHPPGLPRQQRVRAAQPDAAVVDSQERWRRRRKCVFGPCSRRRLSCSVGVRGLSSPPSPRVESEQGARGWMDGGGGVSFLLLRLPCSFFFPSFFL